MFIFRKRRKQGKQGTSQIIPIRRWKDCGWSKNNEMKSAGWSSLHTYANESRD